MPTTVRELFDRAGVKLAGAVRWGTPIALDRSGVYVIATTEDFDAREGLATCPLASDSIAELIRVRPELTIDGAAASPDSLATRLRAMWLAEPVVYVGLAGTNTGHRVQQFYRTRIGARAPHAGGWPLKMLETRLLWVHYGATSKSGAAEREMVDQFAESVPEEVRRSLIDPSAPIPYANLTYPGGRRKAHGISGAREPRTIATASRSPGDAGPSEPFAIVGSYGRRVPKEDHGTCPECFTNFTATGACACSG